MRLFLQIGSTFCEFKMEHTACLAYSVLHPTHTSNSVCSITWVSNSNSATEIIILDITYSCEIKSKFLGLICKPPNGLVSAISFTIFLTLSPSSHRLYYQVILNFSLCLNTAFPRFCIFMLSVFCMEILFPTVYACVHHTHTCTHAYTPFKRDPNVFFWHIFKVFLRKLVFILQIYYTFLFIWKVEQETERERLSIHWSTFQQPAQGQAKAVQVSHTSGRDPNLGSSSASLWGAH